MKAQYYMLPWLLVKCAGPQWPKGKSPLRVWDPNSASVGKVPQQNVLFYHMDQTQCLFIPALQVLAPCQLWNYTNKPITSSQRNQGHHTLWLLYSLPPNPPACSHCSWVQPGVALCGLWYPLPLGLWIYVTHKLLSLSSCPALGVMFRPFPYPKVGIPLSPRRWRGGD